ncbi:MAG TPA: hypothetical protein PLR71_10765 [Deltaproteobacteria bacterium]|nr:hypothetical protein [Deltaproteobacteria bacterium]HQI82023.1 hypothetical protein [Deltaproteobacteria bacterium]
MSLARQELIAALRQIHAADPAGAEAAMEGLLREEFKGLPHQERIRAVQGLERFFMQGTRGAPPLPGDDLTDRLVHLLLGRAVAGAGHTGPELMERLAAALNTVFTMLNDLTGVIGATLGGGAEADQTIRRVIGTSLDEMGDGASIEEHLGQIKKAFLTAQQASKEAARAVAGYILAELDPRTMEPESGGLKIGPLKKAESFEIFEEKFKRVKKWHESERFVLDFLRQFEKNCQRSFT